MTEIFVFGSNLAGRHGKGSALEALRKHGAVRGQGWGLQGNSYAIPTKDDRLRVLPLPTVEFYITNFVGFAKLHPEHTFRCVAIGCGNAGYRPEQIAPMFRGAPANILLPDEFVRVLSR